MKRYRDYFAEGEIHDSYAAREDTEWSNFWYDCSDRENSGRYLLIGDSTIRLIRSTFASVISKPVDMLGTSSGLHDELFVSQIDCFFHQNSYSNYEAVFIQIGHHSRIGDTGQAYNEQDYQVFKREYGYLVDYISQYTKAVIAESVFYSVIPTKKGLIAKLLRCKEQYNEEVNRIKERKNTIIQQVAKEKGIGFCDINQFMLHHPKKYIHKDHIHYEDAAKKVIAEEMAKQLSPVRH